MFSQYQSWDDGRRDSGGLDLAKATSMAASTDLRLSSAAAIKGREALSALQKYDPSSGAATTVLVITFQSCRERARATTCSASASISE